MTSRPTTNAAFSAVHRASPPTQMWNEHVLLFVMHSEVAVVAEGFPTNVAGPGNFLVHRVHVSFQIAVEVFIANITVFLDSYGG